MTTATLEKPTSKSGLLLRPHISKLKPYVPGKPIEEVQRELGLPADFEIIKLASNENVLGPSPRALQAMEKAASGIWLYPDDNCYALKNALAKFWNHTPDHFILGNGSDEIIHFLGLAFLDNDAGDEVVIADPSFVQYKSAAMLADCAYHLVPLTSDWRHDLRAMKTQINERTKLVFIANPNNPTGTTITRNEFEEFLKGLPSRVLVVLDQAYYEYVDDEDSPSGIEYIGDHNVLVLHTFSKAYALAGLRVGYGIARPEIIAHLMQVRGPFNVNTLAQAAALASLDDEEQVTRARINNREGKEQLYAAFQEMGLRFAPTEANFVLVDIERDSKTAFNELIKRGVIVRTGDPFGMPTWIRVTIGTHEMNERFIAALREVRKVLNA
jgi:histidinol-phosphate aminotransferase